MRFAAANEEQTARALEALQRDGFAVLQSVLSEADLAEVRGALAPHLATDPSGRNNFEGYRTQRVYALAGKGPVFADLAEHPRILALCDALLAPNYLLTASQAICIHPGETEQPFHTDDTFYPIARPRPAISISTIWAIDPFTTQNGATEIIPNSHRWSDAQVGELLGPADFVTAPRDRRVPVPAASPRQDWSDRPRAVCMPAGSVIVFLGTLIHRGGANRSARPRLALSNQYCEPWARPQENFFLSIPPAVVAVLSERVQELLGYSIHPPFMGHANGLHPRRTLPTPAK